MKLKWLRKAGTAQSMLPFPCGVRGRSNELSCLNRQTDDNEARAFYIICLKIDARQQGVQKKALKTRMLWRHTKQPLLPLIPGNAIQHVHRLKVGEGLERGGLWGGGVGYTRATE